MEWLPTFNALMNLTSLVCLAAGRTYIGRGMVAKHRIAMLIALSASVLFLAGYLWYHAHAGATRFMAPPALRASYLVLLTSHTILAAAIVPMVAATLRRALRQTSCDRSMDPTTVDVCIGNGSDDLSCAVRAFPALRTEGLNGRL